MKSVFLVTVLLLFSLTFWGCNVKNKQSLKSDADKQMRTQAARKDSAQKEDKAADYADNSITVKESDVIQFKGYSLFFEPMQTVGIRPYYKDQYQRDSIDNIKGDWSTIIKASDQYLHKSFKNYFSKKDSTLIIYLENGKTLTFPEWDNENQIGYRFENYFETTNYILLETIYFEGNGWMLINRKNGAQKFIHGRPYFSPDKKQIITANIDLEAGFSFNGLEYFIIAGDSLQKKWELEINNWGPENIKWITNNSIAIEKAYWTNENEQLVWHKAFTQMTIKQY